MFRVVWVDKALADLAVIWMAADSVEKTTVNAAVQEIDARLMADPLGEGESRSRGRRIMFVTLLAVMFQVNSKSNSVQVLQVKSSKRRK